MKSLFISTEHINYQQILVFNLKIIFPISDVTFDIEMCVQLK